MSEGWHVGRKGGGSEWQGGPYTWQQLVDFATEGRLTPADLVWHPSMPEWLPSEQIPGLFPAPAPEPVVAAPEPAPEPEPVVAAPAPEPVVAAAEPTLAPTPAAPAPTPAPAPAPQPAVAAAPPPPPRKGGKGLLIAGIAVLVVVLLTAAGGGAWYFLGRGESGPKGASETKLPDQESLIQTQQWGEVPANQICVVLAEGAKRGDAEKLAKQLGGSVVGELEFASMYQIEFPGQDEAELVAALDAAKADENVDLAFPNEQAELDAEIWGVRENPYSDPVYGNGAGDGYNAMGVSKAWEYIRGSGVDLKSVHVGITDDGIYKPGEGAENEFEGSGVEVDYPDGQAGNELTGPKVNKNGTVNKAGSHGTGVSTIIAGDPNNGGPAGVAGPLGSKIKISMSNIFSNNYGNATSTPDPNDPTKVVWSNGHTYSFGDLVALNNQVKAGAKVINCSWGSPDASPEMASAYKQYFEKMAVQHPDVIFICSAGNTGQVQDGAKRFPSGLSLPNMITVGAVNNDGTLANYSTKASPNFEVTLAAPGTDAVVGLDPAGGPVQQSGTSFSTPEVTAAAAMLLSINPKLQAADLKRILTETARTSIKTGDKTVNAPAEAGGKVLAIDQAVLRVINELRKAKGMAELTPELLEQMGVIDAVAITGGPGEYQVKGIVKAAGEDGTDVTIEVYGENSAIGGKTTQSLPSAGGETQWSVTLPKDEGSIRVKRDDNGAASLITVEKIDINGAWSGTFTVTDVTITDQEAAEGEGCSAALLQALKGKALPMTMNVTCDESGQGSAVTLIDVGSLNPEGEGGSSEPQTWGLSYNGSTIEFSPQDAQGVSSLTAGVSRNGDSHVMKGSMTGGGAGWSMKAVFTLTKPAPAQ